MSNYRPPVDDMLFVLNDMLGIASLSDDLDEAMTEAILNEAAKLAADVLAPLNHSGDQEGSKLIDGNVITPKGFKEAYAQFIENGWNAVPFDSDYGGQGLPWLLTFALQEMWQSANMSFGLCPLLTQAGVEALHTYGTQEQKDMYLEKLVSGEWTGSMQLTEPQSGTDLGTIRTKAEPQDDGSYKLFGQKIFITYGEHDWTENIIHMVLARVPGAPEGTKGISMFLVPKFLPDGTRNDAYAVGLEHKLGIHASPTCTMQYGDNGGAIGWLIGNENEGLRNMFLMMNNARLGVGIQGIALAERAYQQALFYANDRVQSTRIDDKGGERVKIIEHPDVQRMLLSMKAQIQAARALAFEAGMLLDQAKAGDEKAARKVGLLTPIVKAWSTDLANEIAGTGVQVHGGMGFIEETGAAQYVRDARILSIYEGTNGIQAQDLYVQKLLRDKGEAARDYFDEIGALLDSASGHNQLSPLHDGLGQALEGLREATDYMLSAGLADGAGVSVPYLNAFGVVCGAAMSLKAAQIALDKDSACREEKTDLALFYAAHILPRANASVTSVLSGAAAIKKAAIS